jgi:predicted MPP superfamily phosphohydrolase
MVTRREAIERTLGAVAFGGTGLALGWGTVRGRHAFGLEEVVVKIPNWPRALEGYTIAQVSDVHVGPFVGERERGEGFELVRRIKPDLLVATGDLVDGSAPFILELAKRLLGVPARDGAFAILGNHDHYAGPAQVVDLARGAGLRVLLNESLVIRDSFALVGLDDLTGRNRLHEGFGGPDLPRAVAALRPDMPRILLAHQPSYFLEAAGQVALQLSGHTHGGQINPGFRPADLVMKFVSGRYERNGSTLWVNRGFGTAGPPSRVGAPPEVTKIVIVGA